MSKENDSFRDYIKQRLSLLTPQTEQKKDRLIIPAGLTREIDEEIIQLVAQRVHKQARKPITILEIGAGTTFGLSLHYGAPWLARKIRFLFGQEVEITTSDLKQEDRTVDREIEATLFNVQHICGVNYRKLLKKFPKRRFDIIYGRHLQPLPREESRASMRILEIESSLAPVLNDNGIAALQFYDDIEDFSVIHRFERSVHSIKSSETEKVI